MLVSNGAKHSLMNIAEVLYDEGDEIIMFSPYWVTYPVQAQFVGAKPVVIETRGEDDFQPDLAQVRAAVTDRTVAILLNSPCNPTGAVYEPEIIEGIAQIGVENDLTIVSDEIYKAIRYDGRDYLSAASLPGMKEKTIIVDGVAKAYSMTGWRIGYAAGDPAHPDRLPTVADVVDHIDHIVAVAGIDHVGIGTDFDGGGGLADCVARSMSLPT